MRRYDERENRTVSCRSRRKVSNIICNGSCSAKKSSTYRLIFGLPGRSGTNCCRPVRAIARRLQIKCDNASVTTVTIQKVRKCGCIPCRWKASPSYFGLFVNRFQTHKVHFYVIQKLTMTPPSQVGNFVPFPSASIVYLQFCTIVFIFKCFISNFLFLLKPRFLFPVHGSHFLRFEKSCFLSESCHSSLKWRFWN